MKTPPPWLGQWILLLGAGLWLVAAHAADGWLTPQRQQAYAFDQPRLLAQQELFGLAHGVTLLAATCDARDQPLPAADQVVLTAWQTKQADFLAQMQAELGRFYFGDLAQNQTWAALTSRERSREIALAMKLPQTVAASGSTLSAACQTLAQAVAQPRYDLALRFTTLRQLAQLQVAANSAARIQQCGALLTNDVAALAQLNPAARAWRERYQPALDAARTGIQSQWQPSTDAEAEKLRLAALQPEPAPAKLTAAQCRKLPDWLGSPAADPDHAFNLNH